MWILPVNASYAFHSMFESHGELRAYANLFILGSEREADLGNPEDPAHRIREMWTVGSAVAARLGVVYLAAVMEAYATDIVFELLEKRIREVNQELLNQPPPRDMDEDIWNEIQLEEAELNKDNPFHMLAEITRDYVRNEARQDVLMNMIRFLEKRFGIQVDKREDHVKNWNNLKELRKQIVHHRASSRKTSNPILIKDDTRTIDETFIEKGTSMASIEAMYAFAVAVEKGINSIPLRKKWNGTE